MKKMEEIREMLCEELDKIAERGEISASSLDMVDKLTHSIKSIDTIMAMNGYSNDYRYMEGDNDRSYERGGNSYARGGNRGGGSRRRDSMGRYSRDHYSYNDHKEHVIRQLEDMMEDADAGTKAAIKKAIHSLEE